METTIITISNPISMGFWFTIGAMLAGAIISVLALMFGVILKLLFS